MFYRVKKHFKISRHGTAVFAVIVFAILLRLLLIAQGWPSTNSDEGTWGLMARHIIYRGEFPIFFYGQSYMGSIEAYLGAVLFSFLGSSLFTLRLGLLPLFVLFLLVLYFLSRLLFTKNLALATIGLLCFGSAEIYTRQLKVLGGALETLLFGALLILLASWLTLSFVEVEEAALAERRKRRVLYGCLGLVMGLGIWSHMLILPFVAVALLPLCLFCRRELRTLTSVFWLAGCLIGLIPLLIFNVQYPAQNSIATLWQLHSVGGSSQASFSLWQSLLGTILVSLPAATGANPLCSVSTTPGQWIQQASCMGWQGLWGLGVVCLWTIAVVLTVRELWNVRQSYLISHSTAEKQDLMRSFCRLMLLGSAGLTLLAYVVSPAPALVPVTSARYLVGLLVSTPAFLAPLWSGIRAQKAAATRIPPLKILLKLGGLCLIGVIFLMGTVGVFLQVPDVQSINQQQDTFINDLLRLHITHIYSDYWTCDRLIFQSNERIICSVLDDNLHTGQNRYPGYQTIVESDNNAAYALVAGSSQQLTFRQSEAGLDNYYHSLSLDGYIIYQH